MPTVCVIPGILISGCIHIWLSAYNQKHPGVSEYWGSGKQINVCEMVSALSPRVTVDLSHLRIIRARLLAQRFGAKVSSNSEFTAYQFYWNLR